MKLRLLNASHQALCYTGMLVGLEFAHQTMEDPRIRTIVRRLMDEEVTPLLPPVPGIDVEVYKNTLIERFAKPAIRDQLSRIGTEGSARIAKFVLPSVVDQLARGGPVRLLAFVVASWFRYLAGTDDHGRTLPMNEPMAEPLCRLAKSAGADPRPLLGVHEVFSRDVAASPAFAAAVTEALGSYYTRGAEATLDAYAKR
jgi:mannitol 2-dehydrogenase